MATENHNGEGWPERPAAWGDVLTDLEVCQLIGIDAGKTPEQARRTLWRIRRTHGGPAALGRLGGKTRFRRAAVDSWLETCERANGRADRRSAAPTVASPGVDSQRVTAGGVSLASETAARGD